MYGLREVERLLGLPRSTIRALVRAGFASPARGARGAWQFSFEDLVALRKARALAAARVPQRSIARVMRKLRREAQSGQYRLGLEGEAATLPLGAARVTDWFARAEALEPKDAAAAIRAYERALEAEPGRAEARVNLGRLLHQEGRLARAERIYRGALEAGAEDPVLYFNLGVLLEDLGRPADALEAYRAALHGDPRFADCHYNAALLYKALGRPRDAIRHMARYRRLSGGAR